MDHAEMLMDDIRNFKERTGSSRLSNDMVRFHQEVFHRPAAVHHTLKDFECGMVKNDPEISPSQIYAYAALRMGNSIRERIPPPDHRFHRALMEIARDAAMYPSQARISRPGRRS